MVAVPAGNGRSTFNKRQKEQARQQKQRDKAESQSRRKQEQQVGDKDEMHQMLEHAKAQAALFNVGSDGITSADLPESSSAEEVGKLIKLPQRCLGVLSSKLESD